MNKQDFLSRLREGLTGLPREDVEERLAFYGEMLTENQREMARLHWEEDLSLTEIAQQFSISRQSVHDTLHRVEKQLRNMEEKLGVRARLRQVEACVQDALAALQEQEGSSPARLQLEKAIRLLNDEEETNGL